MEEVWVDAETGTWGSTRELYIVNVDVHLFAEKSDFGRAMEAYQYGRKVVENEEEE